MFTEIMTLDELRATVHAAPFQPFTIRLANGSEVFVPHPDFIALPDAGRTAVVYPTGSRAHLVVDLLLATHLEVQGPAAEAA